MIKLLKRIWNYLKDKEPAELRALWTMVLAWIADLGLTISPVLEAEIGFWIGVAVVILTQVQAILTRGGVISPKTHREKIDQERNR